MDYRLLVAQRDFYGYCNAPKIKKADSEEPAFLD